MPIKVPICRVSLWAVAPDSREWGEARKFLRVGIIALTLAFPVAVMGHLFGHRLLLNLERRKLVKGDATRRQAIQAYNRVKSFHNRTRDRYPYYLLLAGSAAQAMIAILCRAVFERWSHPNPMERDRCFESFR